MKYVIRVYHPTAGCTYYFRKLGSFDGHFYRPVSVMTYRIQFAVYFPSLKSACDVVRLIDKKYRCVIVPFQCLSAHLALPTVPYSNKIFF